MVRPDVCGMRVGCVWDAWVGAGPVAAVCDLGCMAVRKCVNPRRGPFSPLPFSHRGVCVFHSSSSSSSGTVAQAVAAGATYSPTGSRIGLVRTLTKDLGRQVREVSTVACVGVRVVCSHA
jgi:hypothetical protein